MISREQMIEQSVEDHLRDHLTGVLGSSMAKVKIVDSFNPTDYAGELGENVVALGYNFDDGGKAAELGSSLVRKLHTIEVFTLGVTPVWGNNLSAHVAAAFPVGAVIPLKDISSAAKPIIDYLPIEEAAREKQVIRDPAPWQENIWLVRLRVTDEYFAAY